MQKERRKLTYKLASGFSGAKTLQSELGAAIKKWKKPSDRLEPLGADGSEVRFINIARTHQKMLVGVFHKLTKGAAQIIINMDGDGEAWRVETVKAQDEKRPKGEFVEGSLYFGIWKNHVLVLQTSACRAEQFQDYATWLLARSDGDGAVAGHQVPLVSLDDPLTAPVRTKGFEEVRGIKIGAMVTTKPVRQAPAGTTKAITLKPLTFKLTGDVWKGIKAIFGSQGVDLPADIELDEALGAQDVRVSLELSCTKKGLASSAGVVLGQLGRTLSHVDTADVSVTLADGTKAWVRPVHPREAFLDDERISVTSPVGSALIGLALTTLIVGMGTALGMDSRASKILAIAVSFTATWLLRKRIVFQ